MRRFVTALATLLMVLAVGAFAIFVWLNGKWTITLELRAGEPHVTLSLSLLLSVAFVFGVVIGLCAMLLTFSTWRYGWRDTIERLSADNHKLKAANRALEGALPVLREGYDETIGAFAAEPALRPTYPLDHADAPEAAGVSIDELAAADAAARQARANDKS